MAKETIVQLSVAEIGSSNNYRKTMDEGQFQELKASIQEQGIEMPIWVRVNPDHEGAQKSGQFWLLVAGGRRLRAARELKLPTVPAIVKDAKTDEEALALSVLENDQREDVNPMEQALGYKDLLVKGKHTLETLAVKLGKKVPYVQGRLKLLDIPKEAQQALLAGKIEYGHALLIGRLKDSGDQKELLKYILEGDWSSDGPLSVKAAKDQLDEFTLRLASAAFDVKLCATCGYRSRAQAGLFPEEAKAADQCMDRSCFFLKTREHYQKVAKDKEAQGVKVLTSAQAVAAAKGYEISPDPEDYNHPKKYKSACANCEKRAFICYEEKSGGHARFVTGELCLDKKCFNAMNGRSNGSESSGSGSRRPSGGGAARQHALFMRDRFLRSTVPAKVAQSGVLQQRLEIYHILCRFEQFGGQGRTDLKMNEDETFQALMKDICPAWKRAKYGILNDQELYAAVAAIPAKQLDDVLSKVICASVPHIDEEVLLQMTPEAGITLEKDFRVDEAFLKTKTKGELARLAGGFKVQTPGSPAFKADPLTMKKPEIIKHILAWDLTGKVPPDVMKECKLVTLGKAKGKDHGKEK